MKKILLTSLFLSSSLLMANGPIHNIMDDRVKGLSFSGNISDYEASKDGLGLIPLQHHSGTSKINNELKVQKKFNELKKLTSDKSKLNNLRDSLNNNLLGTTSDLEFITKLEEGLSDSNESSLNLSCKSIYDSGNSIGNGVYEIDPDGIGNQSPYNVYCDMTTDGGGWTLVVKGTGDSLFASLDSQDTNHWYNGTLLGDTTNLNNELAMGKGYSSLNFNSVMIRSLSDSSKRISWQHPTTYTSLKDVINGNKSIRDGVAIGGSILNLDYRTSCNRGNEPYDIYYGFFTSDGYSGSNYNLLNLNQTGWSGSLIGWGSKNSYASTFNVSGGFGFSNYYGTSWDLSRHYHGHGNACFGSEWKSPYHGSKNFNGHALFIR